MGTPPVETPMPLSASPASAPIAPPKPLAFRGQGCAPRSHDVHAHLNNAGVYAESNQSGPRRHVGDNDLPLVL